METLQTNIIKFKDGERAVSLWMLDYLPMFWELDGDFTLITYDEFVGFINKKLENDAIDQLLVEKHGFNPFRR